MVSLHANNLIFSNLAGSRPVHRQLQIHSLFFVYSSKVPLHSWIFCIGMSERNLHFFHSKLPDLLNNYHSYSLNFSNSAFLFCRCSGIWHRFDCLCMYTSDILWCLVYAFMSPFNHLVSKIHCLFCLCSQGYYCLYHLLYRADQWICPSCWSFRHPSQLPGHCHFPLDGWK